MHTSKDDNSNDDNNNDKASTSVLVVAVVVVSGLFQRPFLGGPKGQEVAQKLPPTRPST